jgi:hypothetical protein
MNYKIASICFALVLFAQAGFDLRCLAATQGELSVPKPTLTIPPMVDEQSVSSFIPSDTAPGVGLAVNVIYPAKPRYPEGAPVLVMVPGGNRPDGLEFTMHSAQQGFCEVRFAFPGGGKGALTSGGIYDSRGLQSQKALHDVILFASGKLADNEGKFIKDLVPCKIADAPIGIVGWSNGGNIALVTLAKYASDLSSKVSWIVFYESPIGELYQPAVLGGANDVFPNRHYRLGSGATGKALVDWRKLHYLTYGLKEPGEHKKQGESEIPGIVFFDENHNGAWDESFEYALSYCYDLGFEKQIYAPDVTRAMIRLKVPINGWLKLANLKEADAFFRQRDGSLYIRDVCEKYPNLLICIFGSLVDHWQRQPDHPHVASLYNAFLANKAHFVRLNPDPHYLAELAGMRIANFANNAPGSPIDASQIDDYLEGEGIIPDYAFMEAACAELADRKKTGNLGGNIEATLFKYSNGASSSGSASESAEPKK